DCLKFSTRTFTKDSRNEFRKRYNELLKKEIEVPKALDYAEFNTLHDRLALQNLYQFCHVSYRHEDRIFSSQAWNRLFRIQEQVVREYVMVFLSNFTFKDHVMELNIADTMFFQLGGVKRSMSIRQFILALGLYTPEEINNNFFGPFVMLALETCQTTITSPNTPEITMTPDTLLLTPLSIILFVVWFIESKKDKNKSLIVRAHLIGRIARSYGLMAIAYMRIVTLGQETSLLNVKKSIDLGQRDMDDRLGNMDTNIYKLSNDVEDLTYVVFGMSEQYDQFYREFGETRMEQERFRNWNADHLS
nr:hypothetical protein [Tanacetum cinerariifolium]